MELDLPLHVLGSPIRATTEVAFGDNRSTYRIELDDDRVLAARILAGPEAAADAARIATVMARLADAGLQVPTPNLVEATGGVWLLTPWVPGRPGAAWMDTPARARHLAERMGRLAHRLRAVDVAGLHLDAGGRSGAFVLQHGDFAPINVIVDADREIAAVLDLEHARLGPPHTDVAWWGWVVRHHHPEAWAAAWPTFRAAAGVEAEVPDAELHALALLELARRASSAVNDRARQRWVDRLVDAETWVVAGSGQAM